VGLVALLAVALAGTEGCTRTKAADAPVIDRQTFIDTYVDLRLAALASPARTLTTSDREAVLAKHHVTDQDLLHFVDVRGADPSYMVRLWTEVAGRVPLAPPPPSAGGFAAPLPAAGTATPADTTQK
jgi:hypothetical protein